MRHMVKIPITAYFGFSYPVYDAISHYAYKKQMGICEALQLFVELGLNDYLQYDQDLKERYNSNTLPPPSPAPPPCNHLAEKTS